MKTAATDFKPGYLRKRGAADYWGVSVRTLSNLMRAGKVPYFRLTGRLVLFKISDMDAGLARFRVGREGAQ